MIIIRFQNYGIKEIGKKIIWNWKESVKNKEKQKMFRTPISGKQFEDEDLCKIKSKIKF